MVGCSLWNLVSSQILTEGPQRRATEPSGMRIQGPLAQLWALKSKRSPQAAPCLNLVQSPPFLGPEELLTMGHEATRSELTANLV